MTSPTADALLSILDVIPLEQDKFQGTSPANGWKRVFGGQVVAQALASAVRTVDGRDPHSLHGYFILGGDPLVPITYEVDRIRGEAYGEIVAHMQSNPSDVQAGVEMIFVVRNLERIGDHATNMAEDVIYMAKGVDVRHHAKTSV